MGYYINGLEVIGRKEGRVEKLKKEGEKEDYIKRKNKRMRNQATEV